MFEYSDRYGGLWPDPDTACDGPCEGLGVYPEFQGETDEQGRINIDSDSLKTLGDFVLVTCPDCNGTGNKIKE